MYLHNYSTPLNKHTQYLLQIFFILFDILRHKMCCDKLKIFKIFHILLLSDEVIMNLKQYIRHLLYDNTTYESPDIYQRFRIVCPEYSQHDIEVKPYPLPESEHMFGLIWDIHEPHTVSATIIPSGTAFTYEKRFEPGMRTQMHSHEYLVTFLYRGRRIPYRRSSAMNLLSTRGNSA